jgi:hypothetical protein
MKLVHRGENEERVQAILYCHPFLQEINDSSGDQHPIFAG